MALHMFARALDIASTQGALSLELRAATSAMRLWNDTGRGSEARGLLADVYGRAASVRIRNSATVGGGLAHARETLQT